MILQVEHSVNNNVINNSDQDHPRIVEEVDGSLKRGKKSILL